MKESCSQLKQVQIEVITK